MLNVHSYKIVCLIFIEIAVSGRFFEFFTVLNDRGGPPTPDPPPYRV